jgi:hypothetical protein
LKDRFADARQADPLANRVRRDTSQNELTVPKTSHT